jgi:Kef-type K+ transport system membrane component KefB
MADFFQHLMHEFALPLQNPVLIFSLILLIILLSPVLLRRIKIPGIIGLILSGVAIGPHGLGILEKDNAIDLFSTIGLLYIMFIAGLELDLKEFKAHRNKSLLFGLFTFAVPIGLGFPVCHYLLGYDFNASFLTASMFATHTLVAYPIVSKMGVTKNQAVAVAVGGTILTDTAVLIMLAVIMGNQAGTLNAEFWIRLGVSLAIFSAIMFLVIPRIAKWFFRVLESEKHSHYIFVLSVVFFAAFLAEVAGVEPIIGAFVAGLALNKLVPHSSALMNRIEFMGNALFIPFFLVSVGMLVDVSVLFRGPQALIVAGALTTVALMGKWLAALFTQWSFRFSAAQRQLIFGLSAAHAAATLAVILVGYRAGILDDNILNGTIVLILITCIVASFATERAARGVLAGADQLEETPARLEAPSEHILLPISNLANIPPLLDFAVLLKEVKSVQPISLLTVVSNDADAEANILRARAKLEDTVRQASATETQVNIVATIDHNPASGIARISRELMADFVVLGWPARVGFIDKLMGEKLGYLLEHSDKTTLVCQFSKPLVAHKRLFVVVPEWAEKENGFGLWVRKISKLARELSIPVTFRTTPSTWEAIERFCLQAKLPTPGAFAPFASWEDFLILSRDVRPDDLLVLISARRDSPSYAPVLDGIPEKMEKYFADNDRMVIYPQSFGQTFKSERYEDVSSEPLTKGIETVQRIGKGLGKVLRGKR